ncbi:MAG: hypothetical protein FJ149_02745 [Euryarchaeota archaeon]|nr:hypothetical protein [Euryarchaeota archaeon]
MSIWKSSREPALYTLSIWSTRPRLTSWTTRFLRYVQSVVASCRPSPPPSIGVPGGASVRVSFPSREATVPFPLGARRIPIWYTLSSFPGKNCLYS